jgi:hypothetical protein
LNALGYVREDEVVKYWWRKVALLFGIALLVLC